MKPTFPSPLLLRTSATTFSKGETAFKGKHPAVEHGGQQGVQCDAHLPVPASAQTFRNDSIREKRLP
eukprot:g63668.t1